MNAYPPAEVSMGRLYRAGWNAGEIPPALTPDHTWRVYVAKGEHFLDVPATTQNEAWHRAAEQARMLGRDAWMGEGGGHLVAAHCLATA